MKLKTFLFVVLAAGMGFLLSGCFNPDTEVTIVEIGNKGGDSMDDAYALTDKEWAYGYISEESGSRWYSLPAVDQEKFYFSLYSGGSMANVVFLVYNEAGTQIHDPSTGGWTFTPGKTQKWFVEVRFRSTNGYNYSNPFGIGYSTSGSMPTKPNYWE